MADRIIKPDSGNRLVLQDDGAGNTLAIETSQDVNVTNGDIYFGTAGKGIVLGATSNVDANTLDDYEEGTFTFSIIGSSGSAGSWAQTSTTGYYTKIGREVIFQLAGYLSNAGSYGGDLRITGLPFTCDARNAPFSIGSLPLSTVDAVFRTGYVQNSTSYLIFRGGSNMSTTVAYSELNTGSYFSLKGIYTPS